MNTEKLSTTPEETTVSVTATPTQEASPPQDTSNQDSAAQNVAPASDDSSEEGQPPVQETVPINQEKKERLKNLCFKVLDDPRFWAKDNRVKRLEEALKLPMFDERALQQFTISARDELTREAMELAIKNNVAPVMPTDKEIRKRAQEKHEAKLAKESKKKAKKTNA